MFQTGNVEKIKTRFLFNNLFFFHENLAVHEIMWQNMVRVSRQATDDRQYDTPDAPCMFGN